MATHLNNLFLYEIPGQFSEFPAFELVKYLISCFPSLTMLNTCLQLRYDAISKRWSTKIKSWKKCADGLVNKKKSNKKET